MNELDVGNSSKQEAQLVRQESHPSDGSSASEGEGQECNYQSPQAYYQLQRGYFWRYFVLFMTKYHLKSLQIDCTRASSLTPRSLMTAVK